MSKPAPRRYVDIIIAADQADAKAYADKHGHWPYFAVTPRSIIGARGRTGPVYATRKARLHPAYERMRDESAPAGATLPRRARDRRIA
ncbi:hypothetical protein [Leucobacter triazinivorans]|uniref:Uncharacterized protein n=1 Tax=Leucobacter triazinivorans TaxID=1784719 RepID=A0A4P6KF42_9MICO|nr:hypothetical protein [Leucobacter triazinivorans]QBE48760.1 hypothetical protein EVS81_07875 [Leucobacter triazinivorans]